MTSDRSWGMEAIEHDGIDESFLRRIRTPFH